MAELFAALCTGTGPVDLLESALPGLDWMTDMSYFAEIAQEKNKAVLCNTAACMKKMLEEAANLGDPYNSWTEQQLLADCPGTAGCDHIVARRGTGIHAKSGYACEVYGNDTYKDVLNILLFAMLISM